MSERYTLITADCMVAMRGMPDNSVDAVVTDPPYHLIANKKDDPRRASPESSQRNKGFMGLTWDGGDIAFRPEVWTEALRVLKPGGHLLAFGGSRTYHRMVCAIEDAGFEVRDQIMWLYGSGFPKSHNGEWGGTALKPAHEPIVMARKPLIGTMLQNWREHGTGALNIDGCRVLAEKMPPNTGKGALPRRHVSETRDGSPCGQPHELGRWPANAIHDGSPEVLEAFAAFGEDKGATSGVATRNGDKTRHTYGNFAGNNDIDFPTHDALASAARFFYCGKASRKDRNEGTEELPQKIGGMVSNDSGQHITRRDPDFQPQLQGNNHPTVKPTQLMAYLCRLITPPGGVVLDPFMGSGSTGKAAMREGFKFIGIDLSEEYVAIARARIDAALVAARAEAKLLEESYKQADLFKAEAA